MMDKVIKPDVVLTELAKGENSLWYGKPVVKDYVRECILKFLPVAVLMLLFDAGLLAVLIYNGIFGISPYMSFIILPFLIINLAPIWFGSTSMYSSAKFFKNIDYLLTDKNLYIKNGEDVRVIPVCSVTDVSKKGDDIAVTGENLNAKLVKISNAEEVINLFDGLIGNKELQI